MVSKWPFTNNLTLSSFCWEFSGKWTWLQIRQVKGWLRVGQVGLQSRAIPRAPGQIKFLWPNSSVSLRLLLALNTDTHLGAIKYPELPRNRGGVGWGGVGGQGGRPIPTWEGAFVPPFSPCPSPPALRSDPARLEPGPVLYWAPGSAPVWQTSGQEEHHLHGLY